MLNLFLLFNAIVLLPLVIFGIIISNIRKKVEENLHSKWIVYTICASIGTPIHELSHLIFHLIFLHKVEKVRLFRPIKSKKDGVLGYVKFSYNPNSLYHNVGLFCAGIAPMIGGSVVLYFLMKLLIPDIFINLKFFEMNDFNLMKNIINLKDVLIYNCKMIFTKSDRIEYYILFLILAFSISTHMSISTADLKSAVKGGIILEVLLLISSVLLYFYELTNFVLLLEIISSYLISFLILGLIFSVFSLLLSYVLSFLPN